MRDRRAVEVRELELVLHWADLHADDPADDPRGGGLPVPPGGPRLVQLGGVGTPRVVDLSICELALARGQHTLTVQALIADGLDLRHRLPELYAAVREGSCELWVARKVASIPASSTPRRPAWLSRPGPPPTPSTHAATWSPELATAAWARPPTAAVTSSARSRWAGWPTPKTWWRCSPPKLSHAATAPRPGTRW